MPYKDPEKRRQCEKESRQRHKARVDKYQAEYRAKNREICTVRARASAAKKPEKYKATAAARVKKKIDELSDGYMRQVFWASGINPDLMPPDLIEAKRAHLAARRKIKSIKNSQTNE